MRKFYLCLAACLAAMSMPYAVAQDASGVKQVTLRTQSGRELWGNVVSESTPTSNGMYKFGVTSIDPKAMVTASKFVANAGSVYYNERFRFINADYTYAAQGSISANIFDYSVGENDVWTSSGTHKSVSVNMLGVETAFDRQTGKVYGEFYKDQSLSEMEFGVADYDALTRTTIGTATHKYVAIGLTSDLVMYGVATDGNLYSISTTDGTETLIGATGLTLINADGATYVQSGEIDQRDNTFYWAATDSEGKSGLYTVDLTTGVATLQSQFPNGERVYALTVPYPIAEDNAPSSVTNLKATFEGASTEGTVSFKTPAVTFAGELLEDDVEYYVVAGNDTIAHGTEAPGTKVSVPVTGTEKATNTYKAWAVNAAGAGPKKEVSVYVGLDTPSYTLSNVSLVADKETGELSLSWDELAGSHGGYVGDVTYAVLRNAVDTVATGLTETAFSEVLPAAADMASYYYKVEAQCGTKKVTGKSNAVVLGDHVSVPYSTDFSADTDFNVFTVVDANADNTSWKYYNYTPKSAQYSASYNYAADDWLITPPAKVVGGKSYNVKFSVKESNAKYINVVEVKYGEGNTAEAMSTAAFDNAIEVTAKEEAEYSFDVTPENDMLLSVGFHVTSEKAQGSLYITNFSIVENLNDAIRGIVTDSVRSNGVHAIDGRTVRRSGAGTEGLQPGLYIVDGRKVVVK